MRAKNLGSRANAKALKAFIDVSKWRLKRVTGQHDLTKICFIDPTTTASQQEARLEPATVLQNERNEDSTKGFDFSSASANVRAFQGKLLEVAHANMQFAFESAQRLAAIRSPAEFLSVMAEFTTKRSAMFRKHSKELAELSAVLVTNRKEE